MGRNRFSGKIGSNIGTHRIGRDSSSEFSAVVAIKTSVFSLQNRTKVNGTRLGWNREQLTMSQATLSKTDKRINDDLKLYCTDLTRLLFFFLCFLKAFVGVNFSSIRHSVYNAKSGKKNENISSTLPNKTVQVNPIVFFLTFYHNDFSTVPLSPQIMLFSKFCQRPKPKINMNHGGDQQKEKQQQRDKNNNNNNSGKIGNNRKGMRKKRKHGYKVFSTFPWRY